MLLDQTLWVRLSDLIAERAGLHFPVERLTDLQRGLVAAAEELGFEDVAPCVERLLEGPLTEAQLQVLASHLTIGETYFCREKKTLDVIANHVLPELIRARRGREQRIRLWSAGCCSGEEAYSLAILLHQVLPDVAEWHVTILATDINAHFLRRAAAGSYGEWSFRDAPAGFKARYFTSTKSGRYAVRPEIARLVTFEYLNLADDTYPSLATGTNAMDLIFCRNVLMYFTPAQAQKVIAKLHHALIDGGCLVVSPSEASQALFPQFVTLNFPGVILFQKRVGAARESRPPAVAHAPANAVPDAPPAMAPLHDTGEYVQTEEPPRASLADRRAECSAQARALANQGRLADALVWCDRWIAGDKLDPAGHYVRASVLLEQGQHDEGRRSLQRVLYLDPTFVLAHFALGTLARRCGNAHQAEKHFANTLQLLAKLQPEDVLRESDGLTAGRLVETVASMTRAGTAR